MKRILLVVFVTFISLSQIQGQSKKGFNGYDGGMMLHAGFVSKNIKPVDIKAEGVTKSSPLPRFWKPASRSST